MSQNPFPLMPTVGTIPEDQIVGRDRDISALLRLLRSQSVSVEEMRRMGKSLLLKKMAYLCNENKLPAEFVNENFKAQYFSFQGKQNLAELIELLIRELKAFKAWHHIDFHGAYETMRKVLNSPKIDVGGAEFSINLPEYRRSWKNILFSTLDDIALSQEKRGGKLILIFDELPIMLWEWYKEGRHEDAMELLDILRERRQTLENKGIRFVYCGSIGIKVVLSTFRKDFGYTGEPTNEMAEFSLKPFSREESDFLCECFSLSNFDVLIDEKADCLEMAFKLSDGLPFYLATMFNVLQTDYDCIVNKDNMQAAYEQILNDPKQNKAFKQLIDRLDIYYSESQGKQMKEILNYLCQQSDFVSEDSIFEAIEAEDKDMLKVSLYTLLSDHYLERKMADGKRTYKFRYQIFKQWWKINIA